MTNNINKINKNSTYEKKKNKNGNRKLTPDINNNNKNYNKINRTGNNYNRISNVSADKYNKNIKKTIQIKGASKAINKDKNIRKENIRNNLNYRNINAVKENKIDTIISFIGDKDNDKILNDEVFLNKKGLNILYILIILVIIIYIIIFIGLIWDIILLPLILLFILL